MLRIECPYCGLRDELEYQFGGTAHICMPPRDCSDAQWTEYLFIRENPRGRHTERWCHSFGCGQWFNVVRDTVTHEISTVYPISEPKPALDLNECCA